MTAFYDLACTVGGYVVFPSQVHVDGKWRMSINQSRGLHPKIRDRFDLTLECIRRHYHGTASPLTGALSWYADFFDLFEDFAGYVDHFLLNDLVDEGHAAVMFYTDFDDFAGSPLPAASAANTASTWGGRWTSSEPATTASPPTPPRYPKPRTDLGAT